MTFFTWNTKREILNNVLLSFSSNYNKVGQFPSFRSSIKVILIYSVFMIIKLINYGQWSLTIKITYLKL